jgi:hypothetical protein
MNETNAEKIFIEGQVNLEFIRNGFQRHNFKNYCIILIDCREEEMKTRLYKRGQPELFTADMKNWLAYLRNQAHEFNVTIINTSNLSENEMIGEFEKRVGL